MPGDSRLASARSFLSRAQVRFGESAQESLLYAAIELRLGIEARYHEYLDAAEEVAVLRKRGWQLSQLAKDLDRVYRTGEKIISFALLDGKGGNPQRTWLFTPIPRRARQIAERLGDYLHYTPRFRPWDQKWQTDFRGLVGEGLQALAIATTGFLLAPPLHNPSTGESNMLTELAPGESMEEARAALGRPGETIHIRVDYLDALP